MAFSKIIEESMDLTDSYNFSGTVTGAGGDNKPYFFAYQVDPHTVITNGANTKVIFETELVDSASAFATSRFTVPSGEGGYYALSSQIFVDNTDGGYSEMLWYVNGSNYSKSASDWDNLNSNNGGTRIFNLAAGDYVEIYAYQNSGSNRNTYKSDKYCYFGGYKLAT